MSDNKEINASLDDFFQDTEALTGDLEDEILFLRNTLRKVMTTYVPENTRNQIIEELHMDITQALEGQEGQEDPAESRGEE